MGSSVFDSVLFRDMFGTAEMRAVFGDDALVGRYLEVEAALARAQSRCGIVPKAAAEAISAAACTINIDFEKLRHETEIVGYPILPLVHQLAGAAGEAGRFVHWGATTQDIMDTATVLQIRAASDIVARDLREVRSILADIAIKYRDTPMAGRTHLQHALPITFGYKAAVWLSSIDRHLERIEQARPRILLGQFSGAAGTLASVGGAGLKLQKLFCEELDLHQPSITWHVARDGIAEAVTLLGLVTATLGKIATDVMMMSATEFGEVSEPFVPGRGASSTMPQKRNPISSELILAAAKAVRQHVATMLDAMIQDFERATGPWHLEWISLPESFLLTASSLANAKFMLAGLVVHEQRMRDNLDLTHGLIVAEAVMMAAAPKLGRQHAHDVVYDACRKAIEGESPLADILADVPEIVEALGDVETIRRHCDPANYLGLAGQMVDRALTFPGSAHHHDPENSLNVTESTFSAPAR
jgi:3-carboxy-cis,cis-muconate cycloisomerase